MLSKLTQKPNEQIDFEAEGKFEIYNLKENPFPATPIVNASSTEAKSNGSIFEIAIREKEYAKIETNFLKMSQSHADHFRLGFINDTSYIGRGNGKSAFMLYLLKRINENYCLDISEGKNKCFGVYVVPQGGGKIKTFDKFVDLLFYSIYENNIINVALATIRLEALNSLKGKKANFKNLDMEEIVNQLNSTEWYSKNEIDLKSLIGEIKRNPFLKDLPADFPIFNSGNLFYEFTILDQKVIKSYYEKIKKPQEKFDFVFSYLIDLFLAAGFNGAYILIDDFERIPDFQSAIQKRDFSIQLRTVLFDGLYRNAKIGFFNFLLALHAGVPRLMEDAWNQSGLESRVPINPSYDAKNVIAFEKLNEKHAVLLIKKYLQEYRITNIPKMDSISPFTEKSIKLIGELSEYNAAAILKFSHHILDQATIDQVKKIDEGYINNFKETGKGIEIEASPKNIVTTKTVDLAKKAKKKGK